MKILMIAPEPIFEPRGTPFSVVGRLKALSDMGHEVDLITYPFGKDVDFPGINIIRVSNVPGIKKIKIGPSLQKIPLDFLLMCRTFIQLCKNKYDVVHSHEEAGFWCLFLSKWFRTPHLYDMHSCLPQQLKNFQFTDSKILIGIFESFERRVLKYAAAVITICPDLQQYVERLSPQTKSILIENVVEYNMVFGEVDHSETLYETHTLEGKTVFLYTGTFEAYQGLDLLLESAKEVVNKVRNPRFLMVGGHPDQVHAFEEEVNKADLSRYFILTGQVSPQEVPSYIKCADVLLSPRTGGTNTPLKIYAYLKSGVPIVATDLWTHTQVLNKEVSILTEPTPEAYAEGMIEASGKSKKIKQMVENARKLAEEQYSYPVYEEKLNHIIHFAAGKDV